ncbi:unnamed protein product [Brassica rapa]|uniref:Uncharacterized protein n=1 Tax=Brassica campestris TaxID=3711 RepID=A0A8D9HN38_BRACM|nr:unnamed protein product [Brassica rapa]
MCDDGTSLLQGRTAEPVRRQTREGLESERFMELMMLTGLICY